MHREQAENVRNVHVGWFFRHAGTACRVLPRETWRCVPCKRYGGERGEGVKERVCLCSFCVYLCGGGTKGFPKAILRAVVKRCKRSDMIWCVNQQRSALVPFQANIKYAHYIFNILRMVIIYYILFYMCKFILSFQKR